ncbi:MAG: hypothetical protein GYB66_08705 [Chloroflexi bacterium]|nr:hypothetical protein [Chloroflexota bacterium]
MDHLPSTLYAIQTYELAVDEDRSRLEDIEQALAHDPAVASAQSTLETSQKDLHAAEADVQNLELEIAGLTEKIQEVDTLLYSGEIKSPKELQERQDEVDSLRRRLATLEETLATAKQVREERRDAHRQAEADLAEAKTNRDTSSRSMLAERKELEARIQSNLKHRKAIVKAVPDKMLKMYRTMRKRKNGQAVAKLEGATCTACKIEQPSSAIQQILQDDEIVTCVGCGRILTSR